MPTRPGVRRSSLRRRRAWIGPREHKFAHVRLLVCNGAQVDQVLLELQLVLDRVVDPTQRHVLVDGFDEEAVLLEVLRRSRTNMA